MFSPDSKLREIGKGAFQGCAQETIILPSSVEFIEDGVQLGPVLITGDSKHWKMISVS